MRIPHLECTSHPRSIRFYAAEETFPTHFPFLHRCAHFMLHRIADIK